MNICANCSYQDRAPEFVYDIDEGDIAEQAIIVAFARRFPGEWQHNSRIADLAKRLEETE